MARRPAIRGSLPGQFTTLTAAQMRTYLKCRQDMHAWGDDEQYSFIRNRRTRRQQIRRVVQCIRCESVRVEMMAIATGDRIGTPNYYYSEGYQLAKGEKFTARDRSGLRLYRASLAKVAEEEEAS